MLVHAMQSKIFTLRQQLQLQVKGLTNEMSLLIGSRVGSSLIKPAATIGMTAVNILQTRARGQREQTEEQQRQHGEEGRGREVTEQLKSNF